MCLGLSTQDNLSISMEKSIKIIKLAWQKDLMITISYSLTLLLLVPSFTLDNLELLLEIVH